ncbi:MAG: hypothetical protein DI556_09915 [Rhodovulum sulfidophilum]|uniref:Uncharacterized protein n=1 Tax=Rhodovulum sulfidophilum TaxID=35806 RepID=A0A2W5PY03_RHOSU|nr:MAG: hypothetical protein DI556_09915 [Rhodovulum sulfidophilum]
MTLLVSLLALISALVAAVFGLRSRSATLQRQRDDALEHIDTRNRVEEAARDAPTDPDAARDALADRVRRSQRP